MNAHWKVWKRLQGFSETPSIAVMLFNTNVGCENKTICNKMKEMEMDFCPVDWLVLVHYWPSSFLNSLSFYTTKKICSFTHLNVWSKHISQLFLGKTTTNQRQDLRVTHVSLPQSSLPALWTSMCAPAAAACQPACGVMDTTTAWMARMRSAQ